VNDRVEIYNNDSGGFEWAVKTFINRFRKSGLLKDLKLREAYESPSERRRRKDGEAMRRKKRREKRQRDVEN